MFLSCRSRASGVSAFDDCYTSVEGATSLGVVACDRSRGANAERYKPALRDALGYEGCNDGFRAAEGQ